jgi:hypothetical protein
MFWGVDFGDRYNTAIDKGFGDFLIGVEMGGGVRDMVVWVEKNITICGV